MVFVAVGAFYSSRSQFSFQEKLDDCRLIVVARLLIVSNAHQEDLL